MHKLATPDQLLEQISKQTKQLLKQRAIKNPLMVGIHTGGVWVANHLHKIMKIKEPLATLDISFYRDDFSRIGVNPKVKPSKLPPDVEDRHIILVDDVLHTGRTIRAAMNELFDYGRPASITLVCLVNRSGHELPMQPDVFGDNIDLEEDEHIKLTGPEPLAFEIQENSDRTD